MATVVVAYPIGVPLDQSYYLSNHAPMIEKIWKPMGLKSWRVSEITDSNSRYGFMIHLEWNDLGDFGKAAGAEESKVIFNDISNFTKGQPEILPGKTIRSG
ncbi:hypothetical protein LTR86_010177 [Recurvomyces mirabilis]|nr:hypothetical protein LTR86_010177 [Recurvomyces mirabilis]